MFFKVKSLHFRWGEIFLEVVDLLHFVDLFFHVFKSQIVSFPLGRDVLLHDLLTIS